MKKWLITILLLVFLTGCIQIEYQATDEQLEDLRKQITHELREEFQNQYLNALTDLELMTIAVYNTGGQAVIGVSSFVSNEGDDYESSRGSGIIYKRDGNQYYVVTNEHIIAGGNKAKVVLDDLNYIEATIIGDDQVTDLAVLRFTYDGFLPTAHFGDSEQIQPGQWAIAIGNPLGYDYYRSLTTGSISAISRDLSIDYNDNGVIDWKATLIQHHAPISPGNSGGALFDITGQVIGINSMKIVGARASDIGFAIPSNIVVEVIEQLELYGKVMRPFLGVQGLNVSAILRSPNRNEFKIPSFIESGIYVTEIVEGTGAYDANIQEDDIIIKFNEVEIRVFDDLRLEIHNSRVGDVAILTIIRGGEEIIIEVVLKDRPRI